jgi:hypothetical protein
MPSIESASQRFVSLAISMLPASGRHSSCSDPPPVLVSSSNACFVVKSTVALY